MICGPTDTRLSSQCCAVPQLKAPGELPAELVASIEANINVRWCVPLPLHMSVPNSALIST